MIPARVQPRPARTPVDGQGGTAANRSNALAEDLGPPPDAGLPLPYGTSPGGSGPSPAGAGDGDLDGRRRVWRLHAIEGSLTALRRELSDFLRGANLSGDEQYDLLLAACEAASNAVEHAQDPSEPFIDVLSEIGDARVTIVVRDHGQWCRAAPGAHRGRGLAMMWALADTRIAPGLEGTTVTIRSSPRHRCHPVPPGRGR